MSKEGPYNPYKEKVMRGKTLTFSYKCASPLIVGLCISKEKSNDAYGLMPDA